MHESYNDIKITDFASEPQKKRRQKTDGQSELLVPVFNNQESSYIVSAKML